VHRASAAAGSVLRRGDRRCVPHHCAPQRRRRFGLGRQRVWPVQRAGAAAGGVLRRAGRGLPPHGGASQRRQRGGLGPERVRPVQRPSAAAGSVLRRGDGGWGHTAARRSDGSVVAWGIPSMCRRCRQVCPTSEWHWVRTTRWRVAAMAAWWHGATTLMASATYRGCRPASPTSRCGR
jgi:hypothetical protein